MSPAEQGIAQSDRQRLLNRSRETGEDYNLLLTRYAVERLLYRLSQSDSANDFVLKGAMLFAVWTGALHRPTRDLDLLGFGEPSEVRLIGVFRNLCNQAVDDDGMRFDANTVTAAPIRDEHAYAGIRLHTPPGKPTSRRQNLQLLSVTMMMITSRRNGTRLAIGRGTRSWGLQVTTEFLRDLRGQRSEHNGRHPGSHGRFS